MYIQNRRNSSKFKGYSPLQLLNGLIGLKPAIAYFAYTQLVAHDYETDFNHSVFAALFSEHRTEMALE
jgi:hypothetical protein